ncbi:SO_0444 family Cu/Zn efflux transporter [Neiella marina]|uniref:SO_0444 family Cu/Zn efflux transporter n=1 Tax=Neiella holothuriorum TaxID=2870530 RepID=A0ABS7EKH1_9GAMM|nr:SO_0444 family Cu/Zn efflux transporter [Neiella holothuriorum]MBW8192805.1 SO_0444 family Cu/Zn efflux transporter [Neiella holothuriorum]
MNFFNHLIDLSLEAAPYLLLGLIVAGLIKAWLPESWVRKQLSGKGSKPIVKAALLGAPMPLCSCSVIPVALGIRRNGASKGSTVSFLVSTPETGVDSISLTYAMMGPIMAIVRPFAAITTALTAGLWVNATESEHTEQHATSSNDNNTKASSSCCSSKTPEPATSCCSSKQAQTVTPAPATSCCSTSSKPAQAETSSCSDAVTEPSKAEATSCCSSTTKATSSCSSQPSTHSASVATPATTSSCCSSNQTQSRPVLDGIQFAFGKLYQDIVMWLLAGLLIAAAVQTFIPTEWLASWGSGWTAKLIMLVIGIPMYICASASTPIAAGLMLAGVSPGTVLVFLLAGPATNMSTIAVLRNELGQRIMFKYIITVMALALAAGVLLDLVLAQQQIVITEQHQHADWLPVWFSASCLLLLIIAAITPLRDKFFGLFNRPSGVH